jgi:hypothetical protein
MFTLNLILLFGCQTTPPIEQTSLEENPASEADILNFNDSNVLTASEFGDYAVYENKFGNNNRIVTIVYLGDQHYFCKSFNKDNNEINEFDLVMAYKNESLEIEKFGIKTGNIKNIDLQNTQIDFMNIFDFRRIQDVELFPETILAEDPWPEFGYTLVHDFRYWVPLLNLYNRYEQDDESSYFKLIRFGKLSDTNQEKILNFTGIDTGIDNSPSILINEKDETSIVFDGLEISLDENWTINSQNNMAVFEVDNERYSYFHIQTFSKEQIPLNESELFTWDLMNSTGYILPNTVEISQINNIPTLKYIVLDEETLKKTITIMMIFDRGDSTSIVSFGSYLSFYNDNADYFNKILY